MEILNAEIEKDYSEIIDIVKNALKGKSIVAIIIIGSRGKNLHSSNSDYDLRAVFIDNKRNYILQKTTPQFRIKSHLKRGIEVEGTAIDLLQAFVFASNSNNFTTELLSGQMIFLENQIVWDQLKRIGINCISYIEILHQTLGTMIPYIKKHLSGSKDGTCKAKYLGDISYFVYKIFAIMKIIKLKLSNEEFFKNYKIEIIQSFVIDISNKEQFDEYIELRKNDKDKIIEIPNDFKVLINNIVSDVDKFIKDLKKFEFKEYKETREKAISEFENFFYELLDN